MIKGKLTDYERNLLVDLMEKYPRFYGAYLNEDILRVHGQYCEMFHGAGFTDVDLKKFIEWATTPPIKY